MIANYMESVYRREDHWPILEMMRGLAGPNTPFIVLTASVAAQQQGVQALGVVDLIAKPFDLTDLVQRVKKVVSKQR